MTRLRSSEIRILGASILFIAVLTVLIAFAAVAQQADTGRPSGKSDVVLVSPSVSATLVAQERPVLPGDGNSAERVPANLLDRRGLGAGTAFLQHPLFVPAVSYASGGQYAWSVAVADVNGDGKPDLVVTNDCSGAGNCNPPNGSIGVLLGNGDGTFQPAVAYASGGIEALSVAIADVNADGIPDVVVANYIACSRCANGSVAVLLGNGDGTFRPAAIYDSGGFSAYSVAVADVNGDGKPDLLVSQGNDYNGTIGVLLGNGDGTFQPAVTYGGGDSAIVVADVNGDGKLDMIATLDCTGGVCDREGSVSVLLGNGDGTFQPAVSYDSGGRQPSSLAVADVNGDGKPDILVANRFDNTLGVLLGNGDGSFQATVTYSSGGIGPASIAAADVNGDGKRDILVANTFDSTVGVFLGNGDGTFQSAEMYAPGGDGPNALAVADVDGNGSPDLLVANVCDPSCSSSAGAVGVLLHVGTKVTTTTLVSSLNPSTFGQVVTFTARVKSAVGTPTGIVVFFDGSTTLGSATLASRKASVSTSLLAAGSHSIFAQYQGSGTYAPSTSAKVSQAINMLTTTTSLASSQNPAAITEFVTYTATVASQSGGAATGTMVFQDGGTTVATVGLVGNHAAYKTKYAVQGTHAITAIYSGDANDAGSTAPTLLEQIKGFSSKTVLTTSGSPSLINQLVTFTATVTSTHGTIPDSELVTFYDGTTTLGSVPLAGGAASYTTSSLTDKTHIIRATYAGDATFSSSSGTVKQIVNGYATSTVLASSLNPSIYGQAVTWTATVTSSGSITPTGTVRFTWSDYTIGSATLNISGVATLTRSNLNADTYPLTAVYVGDATNLGSTSTVLNQVVLQTTSTATLTSSPNPSTKGQAVTFAAKISSPTVIVSGTVTFTAGKTVLGTAQLSGGIAKLAISSLAVGSTKVTATYYGDSNISQSSASVTQTVQ